MLNSAWQRACQQLPHGELEARQHDCDVQAVAHASLGFGVFHTNIARTEQVKHMCHPSPR
jgi:hypothetical protein